MVYLVEAQDWLGPWIKEVPPIWMRSQRREKYPSVSLKVNNRNRKLVDREYITKGVLLTLTYFFLCLKEHMILPWYLIQP